MHDKKRATVFDIRHNVFTLGDYRDTPGLREFCHAVKAMDMRAIGEAGNHLRSLLLSLGIPADTILVPVPCSQGRDYTARIARLTGYPVRDDLLTRDRDSRPIYDRKRDGESVTIDDTGIRVACDTKTIDAVPERILLLDNVVATGTTLSACRRALGRSDIGMICMAIDSNIFLKKT